MNEVNRGAKNMYFVYMIKNADNKLYVGITQNPEQRIIYHNKNRGAIFTKDQEYFTIVFLEKYQNLIKARQREIQIKKWRRDKKDNLIERYRKNLPTLTNNK